MSVPGKPERTYSIVGPDAYRPPDYDRVVRQLSDAELESEVAGGRGGPGYQEAARAELARRKGE